MSLRPRSMTLAIVLSLGALGMVAACGNEAGDPLTRALEAHADGDVATAERLYREVLADDPGNKYAHYNLGLIDQAAGDEDAAIAAYRSAVKADARFVPALYNLAVTLTEPDPDEAIHLYRKVIAIEPENAAAHLNLGFLLRDRGETADGDAEIAEAVRLEPSLESRLPSSPIPSPAGPATPAP